MKISIKSLALLLLTLSLAGCATGKCGKSTGCTDCASSYVPQAEVVQPVAAPVVPAPVAEPVLAEAPVEEPVEEEAIPAATRRYVAK